MIRGITLLGSMILIIGCTHGESAMDANNKEKRILNPCGDKPNCVASVDTRPKYALPTVFIKEGTTLDQIAEKALALSGAKLAAKEENYLHVECTSKVFRFVDDLEIRIEGEQLLFRSESRVGHSDFGVNRKRVNTLIESLLQAGLIKTDPIQAD